MSHNSIHSYLFLSFGALALFTCLLFLHCNRNNKIDFHDALRRCAEKTPPNGQFYYLPDPECVVGASFPSLACTTIKNEKINADYFKGKICIVNFWFEGCEPCVAEIPGFNNLVHQYGKERLRYLAISRDSREDVEAFLSQHEWDFDHVCQGKSIIEDSLRLPWGYPTTFLLDKGIEPGRVTIEQAPLSTKYISKEHKLKFAWKRML